MSALLAASGISKHFGGVQALAEVSFSITQGEIYGLIGPNGAGKTTLFNLLTGIYAPDSGRFAFDGDDPRVALSRSTAPPRPHPRGRDRRRAAR